MKIHRRAVEIYSDEGLFGLLSRTERYIKSVVEGGISSRKRVRVFSRPLRPLFSSYFKLKYGSGADIMEEEWDTLIILDACRYDDFSSQNKIAGKLESRLSRGSDSPQFINKNFAGRELHDTVYVTANPHVNLIDDGVFHAVIDDPITEWDTELGCVRPSTVTEAAIRAHREFNNKRVIVHYMQPHDPPIGPIGRSLRQESNIGGLRANNYSSEGTRMFEAVVDGEIDLQEARKAYRENLDIVLEEVNELTSEIDGRLVITSDHGEMFGEKPYPFLGKLYEHYRHPRTVELCKVPWLVIEQGDRRKKVSEPPRESKDTVHQDIDQKLKALGYK